MDRNQRSAGAATAVGLMLGVSFALGPKEVNSKKRQKAPRFELRQPHNTNGYKAMAVADYRRCKNEQALGAIQDWRWSR